MDKLLPHNIQAEQSLLAAILIDGTCFYKVSAIINHNDFYQETHRIIFYAFSFLMADASPPLNIITLGDFLEKKDKLAAIGGTEYLMDLLESIPTAANVESDAKIVKEKSSLRKLINLCEKTKLTVLDGNEAAKTIIDAASNGMLQLISESQGHSIGLDVLTPYSQADKLNYAIYSAIENPGQLRGAATGFPTLDKVSKGLRELTLIAADSGLGKTVLGLNWAVDIGVIRQIPCLYINCEMSAEDLGFRILSIISGVEEDALTLGKSEAFIKQINASISTISESSLFITGNLPKTINDIVAMIYQYKNKYGLKVVFIDYLGEVEYDDMAYKEKSEYMTYGRWAQQIKDVCANLDIKPVIIHQLNREGKIAGSLKLERKASLFCTLEQDKNGSMFLNVRKNRGGRSNVKIDIIFYKPTLTMTDCGYYSPPNNNEVPF